MAQTYKVKKNQTWLDLAKETGLSVEQLMAQNPGLKTPSAGITVKYSKPKPQQMYNTGNVPNKNVNPRYVPNAQPSMTPQSAYMGGVTPAYSNTMPVQFGNVLPRPGQAYSNTMPVQFGNITQALRPLGTTLTPQQQAQAQAQTQWASNIYQNIYGAMPQQQTPQNWNMPNVPQLPQWQAGQKDEWGRVALDNTGLAWRNPGIQGDKWRVEYQNGQKITTYARRGGRNKADSYYGAPQTNQDGSLVSGSDWTVSTG